MSQSWRGKRVLVVDDSLKMQEEISDLFIEIGCEVVGVAASGIEALQKVKDLKPDLLSLDIIMPEMDGIECYRALQRYGLNCRAFFITALAADPRIPASYEKEMDPKLFLPKPVTRHLLEERLASILKDNLQIPSPTAEETV